MSASQIIGRPVTPGQVKQIGTGSDKKSGNVLQIQYPPEGIYRKSKRTLPSSVAIPVGLAQVFIGVSMVVCGSFALRYRSYLFYYGTGLWAGTVSALAGLFLVMATKDGVGKPMWLCGGTKWQIHLVIGTTMLSLTASVLMSIFSTSGLMQDTMHSVGVELGSPTRDEETFERRKSTGVIINAILLLLAMLEILLSFCSLGIGLRIACGSKSTSSLFSSDSDGSQVTIHDILGSRDGPEYQARKDRLLRWLGHQGGRNTPITPSPQHPPHNKTPSSSPSTISVSGRKRGVPVSHLVAMKPPQILIPHHPQNGHPSTGPLFYHPGTPRQCGYPLMIPVPFCPPQKPIQPSCTSLTRGDGTERKRPRKDQSSRVGGSLASLSRSRRQTNQRRRRVKEDEVPEITEEEIGRTYTGLDRTVAEDFISNSMDKY